MNHNIILVRNTKQDIKHLDSFIKTNNLFNKYELSKNNYNQQNGALFTLKNKNLVLLENNIVEKLYKKISLKKYRNYSKYFFDNKTNIDNMIGRGYIVDVSRVLNGQPEIIGYSDFRRPIINSTLLNNMDGGGFYLDLSKDNIGGMAPIGSYNDKNPPLFVQSGGSLINKKIAHLINYISLNGNYSLPKYITKDLK